jgi:hypothetical protein
MPASYLSGKAGILHFTTASVRQNAGPDGGILDYGGSRSKMLMGALLLP